MKKIVIFNNQNHGISNFLTIFSINRNAFVIPFFNDFFRFPQQFVFFKYLLHIKVVLERKS